MTNKYRIFVLLIFLQTSIGMEMNNACHWDMQDLRDQIAKKRKREDTFLIKRVEKISHSRYLKKNQRELLLSLSPQEEYEPLMQEVLNSRLFAYGRRSFFKDELLKSLPPSTSITDESFWPWFNDDQWNANDLFYQINDKRKIDDEVLINKAESICQEKYLLKKQKNRKKFLLYLSAQNEYAPLLQKVLDSELFAHNKNSFFKENMLFKAIQENCKDNVALLLRHGAGNSRFCEKVLFDRILQKRNLSIFSAFVRCCKNPLFHKKVMQKMAHYLSTPLGRKKVNILFYYGYPIPLHTATKFPVVYPQQIALYPNMPEKKPIAYYQFQNGEKPVSESVHNFLQGASVLRIGQMAKFLKRVCNFQGLPAELALHIAEYIYSKRLTHQDHVLLREKIKDGKL